MKFPPGFDAPAEGQFCRLWQSLYGLRQAPRCWYAKLASALTRYGFYQCPSDHSFFVFRRAGVELLVLVYVDDLVIAGNNASGISLFKAKNIYTSVSR